MATAVGDGAAQLLTFLIADVRGYTAYTQANGDEAAARLAAGFAEIVREGVEARGGRVIELRGDEALAVFTSARDALRAAVDVQEALVDEVERHPELPLRAGIGLDAGEAVPVEGGYRGGALNLAARLCSQAGPGEVLASPAVTHLARAVPDVRLVERAPLTLKGIPDPQPVFAVTGPDGDVDALGRRLDDAVGAEPARPRADVPQALAASTPIASGREAEARRVRWAWRQARRGTGGLVVISGGSGMGKTRLAAEAAVVAARDGATVLHVGEGESAPELGGAEGPALVVVDDTMKAAELLRSPPLDPDAGHELLVIVTAEPDGIVVPDTVERIVLSPLDADAVAEIVAMHAGGDARDAPIAAILQASAGVPARVHELAAGWVRDEATRRLGEAAARAAVGRSDLRALEAEVATNVIDLQLARERAELFGSPAETTIDGTKESPFKGLAPFDVDDVEVFFGRERLVADIVGKLAGSTFLAVVGPSGSGKSSAVRAGLLPALAVGALPGSDGWLRVVVRPGAHPLRALDRAVWAMLPEDLRRAMESDELPLRGLRDHLDERRVVVVVDQFEEVFTHAEERERDAFVRALVEAADDPRGNAIVVMCLRADYYGRCSDHPRLAELTGSSHVLVGPMTETEYRRAIEGPARRAGLVVEPALVDALVGEVVDEPGALPLLSTALLELWQARDGRVLTFAAYGATGGVRGAVGRLAEDAYASLDPDEQEAARAVMLRLAGPGEGEAIVRRRVQLGEFDVEQNPRVARVLQVFTDARLLTVGDGTVEVAHEALFREWPRLATWLDDDRAGMRLRAHIGVAAKEWGQADRDPGELYRGARLSSAVDWMGDHSLELNELEREFLSESRAASERESQRQRAVNRRLRALLVGAVALLAVALVAGVLAMSQRAKADRSATVATASRLGAQAVIEDDLDTSLLLAAQARAIDDSIETRSSLLTTLLRAPAAIRVLPGTGNRLLEIHQSDDGSVFVTIDNLNHIGVYDTATLQRERVLTPQPFFGGELSPDGTTYLGRTDRAGSGYLAISVSDGSSRAILIPPKLIAVGLSVAFDPDGASFVALEQACADAPTCDGVPVRIVRRSFDDGTELASAPVEIVGQDPALSWSPNGDVIVILDGEDVRVLDAETLRTTASYLGAASWPFDVSEDGRTLAFGDQAGAVSLLDLRTGDVRVFDQRHGAAVTGIGFAPDGNLVSTSDDREVFVWEVASGSVSEKLEGHAGRVFGPAFDADGSTAFTVGLDGRVIAWDLTSERRTGPGFTYAPDDAQCCPPPGTDPAPVASPDGERIAYQTGDGRVVLVDARTGETIARRDPWSDGRVEELRTGDPTLGDFQRGFISGFAFSDDGRLLAVSGGVPEVVLYDARTGDPVRRIVASKMGWVNSVSFAPDGTLVTANDDGRVTFWDPATGTVQDEIRVNPEATSPDDYPGPVYGPQVSPDGRRLAVVTGNQTFDRFSVRMYDIDTHDQLWRRLVDENNAIVAWSPDSRSIAVGHWQDGTLSIHDATTGVPRGQPIVVNAGWVLSVDHSDARHLWVTGGTDGTVRLFDDATLAQIGSNIPAVDNQAATATVVGDGDSMVIASIAGMGWRWALDPARWSSQACSIAARTLTPHEWQQHLPSLPYDPACRNGRTTA